MDARRLLEASLPTGAFDLVSAQCPALPRTIAPSPSPKPRISLVPQACPMGGCAATTSGSRPASVGANAWTRPAAGLPATVWRHMIDDVQTLRSLLVVARVLPVAVRRGRRETALTSI